MSVHQCLALDLPEVAIAVPQRGPLDFLLDPPEAQEWVPTPFEQGQISHNLGYDLEDDNPYDPREEYPEWEQWHDGFMATVRENWHVGY